jgi:plastocyanin
MREQLWSAALVMLLPVAAVAQTVSGQVSILERPGESTEDLGNVVVYLVPQGAKAKTSAISGTMALQSRQFSPRVRVVPEGTKLSFPNQDAFSHNVFSKAPQGPFDTESYGRGKTRDNVFKSAGVYPLYCNVHPRMTAFVIAVNTPHFTQAGADGRFAIDKVPAGKYRIHVWHDRAGEQTSEITVAAGGVSGLRYQMDARNYKFAQHKNKFGKDYANLGDVY